MKVFSFMTQAAWLFVLVSDFKLTTLSNLGLLDGNVSFNGGNNRVLQTSPARPTHILQQLLCLVYRLNLVGIASTREVVGELPVGIVLSKNIQDRVPVKVACETKYSLIFEVTEEGSCNM
jgi:hypothetical protein